MSIYKNKTFAQWATQEGIDDESLVEAVTALSNGVHDGSLGGSIYKKRVACGNRGKSKGVRVLVAYKRAEHTFFLYGFAKSVRSNVGEVELKALKKLGKTYFGMDDSELKKAVKAKKLVEVK